MKYIVMLFVCFQSITCLAQQNASPVIPEADGFFVIKNAKLQPDKTKIYKAIYDATKAASAPTAIIPALNMSGSELNALAVCHIPISHAKFVVVFHGAALFGILDNAHYKEKYGVDYPNLKVLTEMKKAGVQLFVCGQNLMAENIDVKTIAPEVTVASDALIVLMEYQMNGYALLSF